MNYWKNKDILAKQARKHFTDMEIKYMNRIEQSATETNIYGPGKICNPIVRLLPTRTIVYDNIDSVSAIFKHSYGRTAVLNFASYKNPGGLFLEGSSAQEESLCHESTLYDVLLRQIPYYEWNRKNLNKGLYTNRALYSPNVIFERNNGELSTYCDVITCAAPNITIGKRYGTVSEKENSIALRERIEFVLEVAKLHEVDTLILGAFGCGVFGQNPVEVGSIFGELLSHDSSFIKVVFAVIPHDTLEKMKIGLCKYL